MNNELAEVVELGLRVLWLAGLPVVLGLSAAGTLIALLQSATTIQEPALGYAARLATLVALIYFLYPRVSDAIFRLAEQAFG